MSAQPEVNVRLGSWDALGTQSRAIRMAVFVDEQGIDAAMEIDANDPVSLHAVAALGTGPALGTGRLLPDGHIGRMAVLQRARGQGVGTALLMRLMQAARERGDRQVELSAQVHAQGFYSKFGFVAVGRPYQDAGIEHITMRAGLAG